MLIKRIDSAMVLMKTGIVITFLLTAFLCPSQALATTGYEQTVKMWREVEARVRPYQLVLQNLYAEVEAEVGLEKTKLNAAFSKRLSREYPGSFFSGIGINRLAVNNYTKLGFDSQWNIVSLSQQFGSLVKSYDFRSKTLLIANGPNRIKLHLDLRYPEKSQFTEATIPALVVTANDIRTRQRLQASRWPLRDILNDVYAHRISGSSQARMDELAEGMVNHDQTRQNVLSTANDLYASGSTLPRRADTRSSDSRTVPSVNLFSLLPWYFWPGIVGISILGGLTSKNKYKRRYPRVNARKRRFPSDGNSDDYTYEPAFESRQTLHSPAEQAFLLVLEQAVDGDRYAINGKTRLADLIQVEQKQWGPQWQAQFNRISRKHVDFVILEKASSRIIGVIELDDSSHQRPDRQERDRFVDMALERAGIPILHYPWAREYSRSELQHALHEKFGIVPMEFDIEDDWRMS
jgi:hypothetical protein